MRRSGLSCCGNFLGVTNTEDHDISRERFSPEEAESGVPPHSIVSEMAPFVRRLGGKNGEVTKYKEYKYKRDCFYRQKIEAKKSLLRALSTIFWRSVKVFLERKSHFYGRGAAEEFFGNFYGPYFCILLV